MSRCIALTGSALSDRSTPDGTNVDRIPNAIAGPLLHRVQVGPPVRERALAQVFAAGRPVGEVQLQQTHPPELQRQPGEVDPVLELRVPHPLREVGGPAKPSCARRPVHQLTDVITDRGSVTGSYEAGYRTSPVLKAARRKT